MSWFVTLPEPLGDAAAIRWSAGRRGALTLHAGLGSARASERWGWAGGDGSAPRTGTDRLALQPLPPRTPTAYDASASVVRIPAEIVRAMAQAARNSGRSERELWAEAAREWLYSRSHGDEPPPATPAALTVAGPARSWDEIDGLMERLRLSVTPSEETAA
jgi:hypothetical protein